MNTNPANYPRFVIGSYSNRDYLAKCPQCGELQRVHYTRLRPAAEPEKDWVIDGGEKCHRCGLASQWATLESPDLAPEVVGPKIKANDLPRSGTIAFLVVGGFIFCLFVYGCWNWNDQQTVQQAQQNHAEQIAETLTLAQAILAGKVIVGMMPDSVQAAWGPPLRKVHADFANGRNTDNWYYANGSVVLFTDGKVSAVASTQPGRPDRVMA